jgi:hypothetical protein
VIFARVCTECELANRSRSWVVDSVVTAGTRV